MANDALHQTILPELPGGLIPIEEWRLPETSVHRSIRGALRNAWGQLRAGIAPDNEAFDSLDDLPVLSQLQLERFAPDRDYARMAMLLLESVEESAADDPVTFLVAPPFSGIHKALQVLAEDTHGASRQLITPPDNLLLSAGDARAWWDACDLTKPWVIPELSAFWLRHRSGLELIRELLRRVAAGRAGEGLVGCASWCWQFWSHCLPDARFQALTPAPMHGELLGHWLNDLASRRNRQGVVARMSDSGLWVLPAAPDQLDEGQKAASLLRDLAALSRGIPGVALAIWQKALRARPEEEQQTRDSQDDHHPATRPACWVAPLEKLSLPSMPVTEGRGAALTLHALLLHDALNEDRLELVTGLPGHEVALVLNRLRRADLVAFHEDQDNWRVTPLGYPAIRRQLQSDGFPVDPF